MKRVSRAPLSPAPDSIPHNGTLQAGQKGFTCEPRIILISAGLIPGSLLRGSSFVFVARVRVRARSRNTNTNVSEAIEGNACLCRHGGQEADEPFSTACQGLILLLRSGDLQ